MKGVFSLFYDINRRTNRFRKIKNSENRAQSIRYGIYAILNSILFALGIILVIFSISMMGKELGGIIIGFILLLIGISLGIGFAINTIMFTIFQLIMNRKIFGYIALVLVLIILGIGVFLGLKVISAN